VKSIEQELDSHIFVVCGVVRGVWYDGVSESGLPLYGCFERCGRLVYCHVKVVQGLVFFCFCCKLYVRVQGIEIIEYVLDASVFRIKD